MSLSLSLYSQPSLFAALRHDRAASSDPFPVLLDLLFPPSSSCSCNTCRRPPPLILSARAPLCVCACDNQRDQDHVKSISSRSRFLFTMLHAVVYCYCWPARRFPSSKVILSIHAMLSLSLSLSPLLSFLLNHCLMMI